MNARILFAPACLALFCAAPVAAIQVHQAAPIEIRQSESVAPQPAGGAIEPVRAAPVKPSAPAQSIEVFQAAPIQVQPSPAPAQAVPGAGAKRDGAGGAAAQKAGEPPAALFGRRWRLQVPGAAWQTEDRVAGTRTLHVAPGSGTLAHELRIARRGTYVWIAHGKELRGTWSAGVREGYPLTLHNGYEGKEWHATLQENGELLLWDGQSLAGQFRGR